MAFERPSLQQVFSRIQADIESRLVGSNPRLRRSLLAILAKMEAGVAHGLYGDLDWLSKNLLPDTTDPDILFEWADIFGVPRLDAAAASGAVTFTGTNGSVVAAGALLVGANGIDYELQADATIASGTATGSVIATTSGSAGNLSTGAALTLQSPVAGVTSAASANAPGITGGADVETIDAWGERIRDRIREQPQGGAARDYSRWAREAHPAVTTVWIHPQANGAGTVTVYFMTYGATANGIPDPSVVAAVDAYIQEQRPVTAVVSVLAPLAQPLNITLSSLTPNTQAVRDEIAAEINSLVRRTAAPGVSMPVSHINEAISRADDETDHVLASPVANVAVAAGYILVPGTITWP